MIVLTTDLKELGAVKAPPGFADRVLAQVGMADCYAPFETVLGTVYVAWNRLGVSAAARSNSAEGVQAWFPMDVRRPGMPGEAPGNPAGKIQDQLNDQRRLPLAPPRLNPSSPPVPPHT